MEFGLEKMLEGNGKYISASIVHMHHDDASVLLLIHESTLVKNHLNVTYMKKFYSEEAFEESYVDPVQNDLRSVFWSDIESQIKALLESCVYLSLLVVDKDVNSVPRIKPHRDQLN